MHALVAGGLVLGAVAGRHRRAQDQHGARGNHPTHCFSPVSEPASNALAILTTQTEAPHALQFWPRAYLSRCRRGCSIHRSPDCDRPVLRRERRQPGAASYSCDPPLGPGSRAMRTAPIRRGQCDPSSEPVIGGARSAAPQVPPTPLSAPMTGDEIASGAKSAICSTWARGRAARVGECLLRSRPISASSAPAPAGCRSRPAPSSSAPRSC